MSVKIRNQQVGIITRLPRLKPNNPDRYPRSKRTRQLITNGTGIVRLLINQDLFTPQFRLVADTCLLVRDQIHSNHIH